MKQIEKILKPVNKSPKIIYPTFSDSIPRISDPIPNKNIRPNITNILIAIKAIAITFIYLKNKTTIIKSTINSIKYSPFIDIVAYLLSSNHPLIILNYLILPFIFPRFFAPPQKKY